MWYRTFHNVLKCSKNMNTKQKIGQCPNDPQVTFNIKTNCHLIHESALALNFDFRLVFVH